MRRFDADGLGRVADIHREARMLIAIDVRHHQWHTRNHHRQHQQRGEQR